MVGSGVEIVLEVGGKIEALINTCALAYKFCWTILFFSSPECNQVGRNAGPGTEVAGEKQICWCRNPVQMSSLYASSDRRCVGSRVQPVSGSNAKA